ncbi:MAG: hypothetical protein A2496_04735 [Burkholderiales bacterium RIFOXYC12_FULL_60_6]|nr:MAG: hypothetical protein A2503_12365 [Burkholderiales bacterium RIFOXYD12_FULL_59_19]OGB82639.1 MAG: hypothetical protein A2496_04735 [Burkholderiales bacterium RIFOXYC12_FULL_60_6]
MVSWDVVYAKQELKDAKKSETLLEPTRAASTSSIDWFTKYSPKREPSVYCVCGPTVSERANRSAHAQWHNPAVVDEVAARFQLPLSPAWIAGRNMATGASVFGVGFQMGSEAPEGTDNVRRILAKPQVQDSDPNNTGCVTMPHTNMAVAHVECAQAAI